MSTPEDPFAPPPGDQPRPGDQAPGGATPPPGYGTPPPGYGEQPGYGAPPPGYGQPPPGYGVPPASAKTNVLAIISLVTAFLCAPVGLVCGIIAINQIKRTGERGHGLAVAGIVVSVLGMLLGIALQL